MLSRPSPIGRGEIRVSGRAGAGGEGSMATADFTSGNLELGGLNFHYTDWGGDGPPLVMLHGLSGHARTWDHTAAALRGRYRVLALDQRGHGDSDWAPQYGFGPMAGDLLAFLDAMQLGE